MAELVSWNLAGSGYSAENPLGLPRDDKGSAHQLQLKRLKGTGYKRRIDACRDVIEFLDTIHNRMVVFKSLALPHHIVVILIMEEA